jgi:hypothetical protein
VFKAPLVHDKTYCRLEGRYVSLRGGTLKPLQSRLQYSNYVYLDKERLLSLLPSFLPGSCLWNLAHQCTSFNYNPSHDMLSLLPLKPCFAFNCSFLVKKRRGEEKKGKERGMAHTKLQTSVLEAVFSGPRQVYFGSL